MLRRLRNRGENVTALGRNSEQASLRGDSEDSEVPTSKSLALPFHSGSAPGNSPRVHSQNDSQSVAGDSTLVETAASALDHDHPSNRDKGIEDDPLGLSLIYGAPNSDVDIIFVHGLGGSSYRTWSWERNRNNFWPAWLRHEQGLSHFRFFSFGYNANFHDSNNPLSILDFSKSLLLHMRTYRQEDESSCIGTKPIIFIAHSMGGLVVKKALIVGKHDDHYSSMLSKVHGIMFLSTPHRGSSHAHALNTLLSIMIGSSSKVYVSELESSSTSIEDIREQFRAICSSWKLVSLYESLPTKLLPGVKRMIVSKDSGVLDYPQEISGPVDADHHTVCKYHSRLDPNYLLVANLLREMTQNIISQVTLPIQRDFIDDDKRVRLRNILGVWGDVQEDLDRNLFQAFPDSCQWLHHQDSFIHWLNTTDNCHRILCLTGLPGTGKSTLAATTVDYIRKAHTERSCQYYFFVESQPTKRSLTHCLKVLVFQLAISYPALANQLLELHRSSGFSAASQKFQVIWKTIFQEIIFKFDFDCTLHWVIDAVDEADTPKLLAAHFTQMEPRSSIKILLLTRPMEDVTGLIKARLSTSKIETISIESTINDIQRYVRSLVHEILPDDKPTQETIIEQITKNAQGSFQWAKLTLESLRNNWHTADDIKLALNSVHEEMQSLYQRMLDSVKKQPPKLQSIAFIVLAWALCGFRPLSIAELSVALKPDHDGFTSLSDTVVQICGQFIRVDNDTISLIHNTARQFLLQTSSTIEEYLGTGTCHDHLAITCLRYLCQDHWRQTLSRLDEDDVSHGDRLINIYSKYPLLHYSLNHWSFHVSNAISGASAIVTLLHLFCGKFILQWIHAVSLSNNIQLIPRAARDVEAWIVRTRKNSSDTNLSVTLDSTELLFLEEWTTDLIRVTGKFGPDLLRKPSAIYKNVPPLCPESSIISRTYNRGINSFITVKGLSVEGWDDRLARLPFGPNGYASKIRCTDVYILTLMSHPGTVIMWYRETCSEARRLEHGEWVTILETNKTGSLAATSGRITLRVWDLSTGQQLFSFMKSSPARVLSLEFINSDAELAIGYDDCSVISISLESSKESVIFIREDPGLYMSYMRSARFMALSSDRTYIAIGFLGRPVEVWDMSLSKNSEPRICIRAADKCLDEGDPFNSPDAILWHPNCSSVFILYHDTTIVMWDLVDDEQVEFGDTKAREIVLNYDGSLLLTSNNNGCISIWALPKLNLIYHLESEGFVRDLSFSPDSRHIYDVRGSSCNIWAPATLVRPNEGDSEEISSNFELSEPVYAHDHAISQSKVTALAIDDEDEYFCCGRDDGSVSIHSIMDGKRVRKVTNHSTSADIICIGWSSSRRYLASGDDSGKIIVKRLLLKGDEKFAVFPNAELRVDDGIFQLLFDPEETLLLISTKSSDIIWGIHSKKVSYKKTWERAPGRMWLNHPQQPGWLVQLWPNHQLILQWADLEPPTAGTSDTLPVDDKQDFSDFVSFNSVISPDDEETVTSVVSSINNYLIVEIIPHYYSLKTGSGAKWGLVSLKDLVSLGHISAEYKTLFHLDPEIQHILGCYHDRLVFLDHMNWVCTWKIGSDTGLIRRLFFLPRDWINALSLSPLAFSKKGTLLCAVGGDVAIVQYPRGF
ncbi:hypothetical protein F4777DRAFT_113251 [Nemania sp. FL0916]|nr:hypothetical protein F4777DRAFT_113251 [Nemania sp. FL0916]